MADDLLMALHLAEIAAVCLRDAVLRREVAETALPRRSREFATLSDDAAMSAAWRIADCGLVLRQYLEAAGLEPCGMSEPTGRGALLPAKVS